MSRSNIFIHSGQTKRKLIDILSDDLLVACGVVGNGGSASMTMSNAAEEDVVLVHRQLVRMAQTLLTLQLNVLKYAQELRAEKTKDDNKDDDRQRQQMAEQTRSVTRFRVGNAIIQQGLFLGHSLEEIEEAVGNVGGGGNTTRKSVMANNNNMFAGGPLCCIIQILQCFGWFPRMVDCEGSTTDTKQQELWFEFRAESAVTSSAAPTPPSPSKKPLTSSRVNDHVLTPEWAQHAADAAQVLRRALEQNSMLGTARGGFKDFLATGDDTLPDGSKSHLADDVASLNELVSAIVVHAGDAVRHGSSRAISINNDGTVDCEDLNAKGSRQMPTPPPRCAASASANQNGGFFAEPLVDLHEQEKHQKARADKTETLLSELQGDKSHNQKHPDADHPAASGDGQHNEVMKTLGCDNLEAIMANVKENQRRRQQPKPEDLHNKGVDAMLAAPGNATREGILLEEARVAIEEYATKGRLPFEAKFVVANNWSLVSTMQKLHAHTSGRGAVSTRSMDRGTAAVLSAVKSSSSSSTFLADAEKAISWISELDDDPEVHIVLLNTVAISRTNSVSTLPLAIPCLEKAIAIAEKEKFLKMKLILIHNLAKTYERLREFEQCLQTIGDGMVLSTDLGDKGMQCRLLGSKVMCLANLRRGVEMIQSIRQLHNELRHTHFHKEHNVWSVETEIHKAPLLPKAMTALTVYGRFRVFPVPIACGTTVTQQTMDEKLYKEIDMDCARFGSDDDKALSEEVVKEAVDKMLRFRAESKHMPMLIGWVLWQHVTPDRNILLRQEAGADKEITLW